MITVEEFLKTYYSDQAANKNYQSIASYVDGLKPTARKVIHTVLKNNIKDWTKVEVLANRTAGETEYLGGANNISGVVVTISKGYSCSNNLPLLDTNGNFGQRLNTKPGEPRYIKVRALKNMKELFNKDDYSILEEQIFEGTVVEPKFLMPSLPIILLNGSEGIGSGHAQNILPRNIETLKAFIKSRLNGDETPNLIPYWNGFKGTIRQGDAENKWITRGVFSVNRRQITITELPVGYNLLSYTKKLDDLEDKKIIKSYVDKSDTKKDVFEFIVTVDMKFDMSDENIIDKLKLETKFAENYTSMDENNSIRLFKSADDILDAFIEIKQNYMNKRKENILKELELQNLILRYKALFIKYILDGKIIVNKRSKDDIKSQLDNTSDIEMIENSYDYLLNMPIYSLTSERIEDLKNKIRTNINSINYTKEKSVNDMILEELNKV